MKNLFTSLIALLFSFYAFAQDWVIDSNKFIEDTQISYGTSDEINIVWWIPVEFWEAIYADDETTSQAEVDQIMEVFKPYSLFAVVNGDVGTFGGVTYKPLQVVQENIELIGPNEVRHQPLDHDKLSPDLKNMLDIFKPMFKNMMGQLGENMHFIVFSDEDGDDRILDPRSESSFQLTVLDETLDWDLPLASLLPPKSCPVDGELMNGKWKFCPHHGKKLEAIKK